MNENDYRISWVAPQYDHHEHSADWYWAIGIASVSFAVAFIIVSNTLLAIIILLGMGTLLYYAKHEPKIIEYEFSKRGVRTGKTLYPWETLDSFWILEGHTTHGKVCAPKLLLISKKRFMPHIVILLDESVVEEVHQSLQHMLPEEPQAEPFYDRLMRLIGF